MRRTGGGRALFLIPPPPDLQPQPRGPSSSSSSSSSPTRLAASWRDYLPRIVDAIPRRVPEANPGGASLTFPSAADAADAARRLFFPESLADPATLTIPVLIFGALAVGVGVEVASLALRALPGRGGVDGEGGGAGTATADEEGEEGGVASPQPEPALEEANAGRVMGERYRGLAWLAGAAGLALYSAGLLTGSEKPLQP